MSEILDTIVLGGGIVGASAAYALIKRGEKTLLVDQFVPGHDRGSSHGDGRVFRLNYPEDFYVDMAAKSLPLWQALSDAAGRPVIQKTGIIEYGPAGSQLVEESRVQLENANHPHEVLSPKAARSRFPQFAFAEDKDLLFQADGAVVFAGTAVQELWRLFQEGGGITHTETRIEKLEVSADSVSIIDTTGKKFTAKRLVMAAGAWTNSLLTQVGLKLPIEVTQEVLAYFPPKDDNINYRVGTMPVMVDYHLEEPHYTLPIVDVGGVKIGWHHTGPVIQADDERHIPQEIMDGIQHFVRTIFPHLEDQPMETVTCLYSNSVDYHFILDTHPEYDHLVIGAGFSGHGFKFGPLLGEILADLALGTASPVSLEPFSLRRFEDLSALERRKGV